MPYTQLSPMATPGRRYSFSAKDSNLTHWGLYVAASDRSHQNVTASDRAHLNVTAGDRRRLTVTAGDRQG